MLVVHLRGGQTLSTETAHHRPKTIELQLDSLTNLNRSELQRLWRDSYGSDPPEKIGVLLMRQAIAHRKQMKHLGGLNFSTRRALKRILEEPNSPHAKSRKIGTGVANGTVLVREWHGAVHQVTATEKGVLYRGRLFRSLSEVARGITGTRWSGPLFFGLRKSSRKSNRGTN
jgi:hypothetical protein